MVCCACAPHRRFAMRTVYLTRVWFHQHAHTGFCALQRVCSVYLFRLLRTARTLRCCQRCGSALPRAPLRLHARRAFLLSLGSATRCLVGCLHRRTRTRTCAVYLVHLHAAFASPRTLVCYAAVVARSGLYLLRAHGSKSLLYRLRRLHNNAFNVCVYGTRRARGCVLTSFAYHVYVFIVLRFARLLRRVALRRHGENGNQRGGRAMAAAWRRAGRRAYQAAATISKIITFASFGGSFATSRFHCFSTPLCACAGAQCRVFRR